MNHDPIDQSVQRLERADVTLKRALERIPDDRLHWTPAETARTPLQIFSHCGIALGYIARMLEGNTTQVASPAEMDAAFRQEESVITDRQTALDLWDANRDLYAQMLESKRGTDMDAAITLPFGMGTAPLHAMLDIGPMHTSTHVAQIEYLQTVLGDRTW